MQVRSPRSFSPWVRVLTMGLGALGFIGTPAVSQCTWVPGAGFDLALSSVANSNVQALLNMPNGDLIAGGLFNRAGSLFANNVAQWNGTTWSTLGTGTNGQVNALARAPNGDVIAVGSFTLAGGIAAARVARWNGVSWAAFGSGVPTAPTSATVLTNGDVVVTDGASILRWSGSAWLTIGTPAGGLVREVDALPNGDLVAVGGFATVNGITARRIARWLAATATWAPVGAGTELSPIDGEVIPEAFAVEVRPNGVIEVGGRRLASTYIGSFYGYSLATWNGTSWSVRRALDSFHLGCSDLALLSNGDLLVAVSYSFGNWVELDQGAATTPIGVFGGAVQALAGSATGPYYAGGDFSTAAGVASVDLARNTCPSGAALARNYGAGCYDDRGCLFENFPAAGSFDLSQSTLRWDFDGYAYTVTHVPGAPSWTAPISAAVPLTDDSLAPPTMLPFSIPLPGGTTNRLIVGSNGFVHHGVSPSPSPSAFYGNILGLAERWAPMWGDLDPGTTGGGTVHIDVDAITQTVTVTWLNVQEYGVPTNTNSFQLVARATGDVEYRYLACASSVPAIVGWWRSAGGSPGVSVDLGQAGPFAVAQPSYPLGHRASGRPVLGTTIALETSFVPSTSILGATILGLTQFQPGIDLASIGMPGCRVFTTLDVFATAIPSVPSFSYPLAIPSIPSLVGFSLYSQGMALVMGLNPAGFITANGVELVVGNS